MQDLSRYGVTTTLSMACFAPQLCTSLLNHTGLVDVISGSLPAAAPNSTHGNLVTAVDGNSNRLIHNSSTAAQWLEDALAWGPAFVKIIAETPGLSQETINILTKNSHQKHKRVACHAADYTSYVQAATAGVDNVQHSPLDSPITLALAKGMACNRRAATPTLTIMKAISEKRPSNYSAAEESVRRLKQAGVSILAGTDANLQPGLIASVPFGSSIHDELGLLVTAGLNAGETLRAATSVPTQHWGLYDRGTIAPGKRADLLLISGNPLEDIRNTQNIRKVWLAGVQFDGEIGTFL
ncbi:hypothetical protein F5Y18DRAFT_408573 [Xylariaceae sp. FL1019]|nr:hypothetical protein F5Y18DRAFT_408573 [Xylariaceae sp. FL1019]